jgi:hypothetical protein
MDSTRSDAVAPRSDAVARAPRSDRN